MNLETPKEGMMNVSAEVYVSEFGWAMGLPPGFEKLPAGPPIGEGAPAPLATFVKEDGARLTWMVSGVPVNKEVAARYAQTVQSGAAGLSVSQVEAVAQRIFPLIGTLDSARVVELADGTRCLELLESFTQPSKPEPRRGYQLIFPLNGAAEPPLVFQRLCFYASADDFYRLLPQVREAAESFHYTRPFGLRGASASNA